MFQRFFLSLTVLLAPFAVRSEEKPKPVDPKAIQKFVEQLGSDDFDTRENAVKSLLEADEALPLLKTALKSSDAEVRRRAMELIHILTPLAAVRGDIEEISRNGLNAFLDSKHDQETTWKALAGIGKLVMKRTCAYRRTFFRPPRSRLNSSDDRI